MSFRRFILTLVACAAVLPLHAGADDRARVTALADRFVAEFQRNFPLSYSFSGLPVERNDGLDINAPADIARWQSQMKELSGELGAIDPNAFANDPEWVTWQFLNFAVRQNLATKVCRGELWGVSALGWQSSLSQIASMQPVGSDTARREALTRWRALGPWVDQEIANLQEGLKLGYLASAAATGSTIAQLDSLLAQAPAESTFMEPATRDGTEAFAAEWKQVVEGTVWPALTRYRDFLRDTYLPRARTSPSLDGMPGGRDCYRAAIFAVTTVDTDPDQLFTLAQRQIEREHAMALDLGRKLYGEKATDWKALSDLMRAEPSERFATKEEVRDFTQRTYERAEAAAAKMVLTPPAGKVVLEPFPEFQQATAPGGQYVPAAQEGSRPAKYLYRNVTADLYRSALQNVILHETLPGHHLQQAILAEHGRKGNHPIAQLLYFSGPGEGWATYAEDFARELGLYDTDRDYIGAQMSSITPMMVVDLGMQVKGWPAEQAVKYLQEGMPLRPPQRAEQSVALISSIPGFVLAYPLGGIKWQEMRTRAEQALGDRFDVRAFHQVLLEDGMLPFDALEAKLDRWIANQKQ